MIFEDFIFNYKNDVMDKSTTNLYDASTGFLMGNMFKDEYVGYKNYKVNKLIPTTEKGALLLQIYELDFAMNDFCIFIHI